VAGHGCKWRGLPEHFGNGHTVYTRMNRWSRNGVPDRVFEHLQRSRMIRIRIEAPGLDSTGMGCPRRYGGARKNGTQCIGRSRGGWNTRLYRVAADARTAIAFALSPGNAHDAPQGRRLLKRLGQPKHSRTAPRECDREPYQRRNEIERLFRRLKGFRRVFPRFDRLDVMFLGFVVFALIVDALRSVNTP